MRLVNLPSFDANGDLPIGVYRLTLREALQQFGAGSAQRQAVGRRLEQICNIAAGIREVVRFVVFGSFVTNKAAPNDVDIFMLMDDTFDAQSLTGDAKLLFEHAPAQAYFGASVFWLRRMATFGDDQTAVEYWQVKRGGGKRGILEIELERP